jgi:hypothetical protein
VRACGDSGGGAAHEKDDFWPTRRSYDGARTSRGISAASTKVTTTFWILALACLASYSSEQKCRSMATAASRGVVMRAVPLVLALRTCVFTTAPYPSHGPLPWPGQPKEIHMCFRNSSFVETVDQ